jgi:hypothetical protein
MKKLLLSLMVLGVCSPAFAGSKVKEFYTMNSMGCMILRECTEDVRRINSISDIESYYPDSDFSVVANEFNSMLLSLNKIGVMVFLGPERYFPPGHRGVYHTVTNNFYLNDAFMKRPDVLMTVMRHEGWHAAQDCMAGTIDNSMIAIIKPEEDVPRVWRDIVEKTYPKSAVPWESEAKWAGMTGGMTAKALSACANGPMWEVYKPTPLTKKWLEENGFID